MATDTGKLRGMSDAELQKEEAGLREEVWKLKMQQVTGQLQDPNRVKIARRGLARVLTIRRERELEAAKGADK
jgi:large subunit ribosomal protein L29